MVQEGSKMFHMEHFNMKTASGIAEEISARLSAAHISLRSAADQTGIPLQTLRRRLMGTSSPINIKEIALLAELLGTTIPELASDAERHAQKKVAR